ncbi:MAG TPA: aminotransferase class I/II-fold pyridoxal phosphate-dependent enzyme [Nitrososphaerales archaeon]|nr:aminotransferase class I/II-fold pyridoxal phosphate-dependent enzyme [Nitrososphaerales archaeon]
MSTEKERDYFKRIETKIIHSGEPVPRILGSVSIPIFQSAMFETSGEGSYHDIRYIRLNNTPNHLALHKKLAILEGAEDALVTASGMAAISTALLGVLSKGDHLLVQDCLYGGTHDFVTKDLPQFGITYDFFNGNNRRSWEEKLRPNTKAIYVETMTNPLLEIADLRGVVEFSKSHNLISIIDNTFASPMNFRPPEQGFDLSLHSATKYLNGHSDIVAGAIIGRGELIRKIKRLLDHLGGSLDPHACFLLHRGMKTLALRVRYQNESAMKIAAYLSTREGVAKVNYPGLDRHPQHRRAGELFQGCGGVLSFELKGGKEAADLFIRNVTIPIVAPSLGGVESLITIPATTSHSGMSPADRQKLGITDGLIRFSVGIEATEDIIEDFRHAFEVLEKQIPIRKEAV